MTGAAGFIGRELVSQLLAAQKEVVVAWPAIITFRLANFCPAVPVIMKVLCMVVGLL